MSDPLDEVHTHPLQIQCESTCNLFSRFARNGGVDAKDFQRIWRKREMLGADRVGPGGSNEGRLLRQGSEILTEGDGRGRNGNGSKALAAPGKTFKVSTRCDAISSIRPWSSIDSQRDVYCYARSHGKQLPSLQGLSAVRRRCVPCINYEFFVLTLTR